MRWENGPTVQMRVERVEESVVFGFTWPIYGLPEEDPRRTYVESILEPTGVGYAVNGGRVQVRPAARRRAR